MTLTRVNNYRYSSPILKQLSSQDTRSLSNTELVLSYNLTAKVDRKSNKFIISSNEKLNNVAQAGEITTRDLAEIEA